MNKLFNILLLIPLANTAFPIFAETTPTSVTKIDLLDVALIPLVIAIVCMLMSNLGILVFHNSIEKKDDDVILTGVISVALAATATFFCSFATITVFIMTFNTIATVILMLATVASSFSFAGATVAENNIKIHIIASVIFYVIAAAISLAI